MVEAVPRLELVTPVCLITTPAVAVTPYPKTYKSLEPPLSTTAMSKLGIRVAEVLVLYSAPREERVKYVHAPVASVTL